MFDLFKFDQHFQDGRFIYQELVNTKPIIARQLRRIKIQYRAFPAYVLGQHPLVRLLVHTPLMYHLSDREYVYAMEDLGARLHKSLGFSSPVNKGYVYQKGFLLGPNSSDIVLYDDSWFDVNDFSDMGWMEQTSVNVAWHSRYDLNAPILTNQHKEAAYGVFKVHYPKLALQFRKWVKYKRANTDPNYQDEPISKFIGGYVLPNMIDDFTDIAWFNRIAALEYELPIPKDTKQHFFWVLNLESRANRLAEKILTDLYRQSYDIRALPFSLPMLAKSTLNQYLQGPDLTTKQNTWSSALSFLPYLKLMIEICFNAKRTDHSPLNEIGKELNLYLVDKSFNPVVGTDFHKLLNDYLSSIAQNIDFKLLKTTV